MIKYYYLNDEYVMGFVHTHTHTHVNGFCQSSFDIGLCIGLWNSLVEIFHLNTNITHRRKTIHVSMNVTNYEV